jgi:hypothetical protein
LSGVRGSGSLERHDTNLSHLPNHRARCGPDHDCGAGRLWRLDAIRVHLVGLHFIGLHLIGLDVLAFLGGAESGEHAAPPPADQAGAGSLPRRDEGMRAEHRQPGADRLPETPRRGDDGAMSRVLRLLTLVAVASCAIASSTSAQTRLRHRAAGLGRRAVGRRVSGGAGCGARGSSRGSPRPLRR